MIPTQERVRVEGNIAGRSQDFRLDPNGTEHLISVLIRQYSDREMATLREISTNARDANIDAGRAHLPIEVTLPSDLSQHLRIRDRGTGLSEDDLFNIFSVVGSSTKRESNEQNGCLGIGSKAPLCYADQFSLTTVKDGVKIVATIAKDQRGVPVLTAPLVTETDEEPGTEVVIPTRTGNEFESKARHLFGFWEPGTVLVNGEEPQATEGLRVSEEYAIIAGTTSYVVQAGVPYPTDKLRHGLSSGFSLVAWVPTGCVDFVPSREGLEDTDLTRDTLATIGAHFAHLVQGIVQREIDKADTPRNALKTMIYWRNAVPKHARESSYTYRGDELPLTWREPGDYGRKIITTPRGGRTLSGHSRAERISPQTWLEDKLWVQGYVGKHGTTPQFTASHKRKLQAYVSARPHLAHVDGFILTFSPPPADYVDPAYVARWEDVNAIKLAVTSSGGGYSNSPYAGRLKGSYDCYVEGREFPETPANDIETSYPLFFIHGNLDEGRQFARDLHAVVGEYTLVCLPGNRVEKFQRDFPMARKPEDGIREAYDAFVPTVRGYDLRAIAQVQDGERDHSTRRPRTARKRTLQTKDTARAWQYTGRRRRRGGVYGRGGFYGDHTPHRQSQTDREDLQHVDPARVADPKLKAEATIARRDIGHLLTKIKVFARYGRTFDTGLQFHSPLDKYPLFDNNHSDHDHTYIYLNAVYATEKEQ